MVFRKIKELQERVRSLEEAMQTKATKLDNIQARLVALEEEVKKLDYRDEKSLENKTTFTKWIGSTR
jgi:chromosome segregation ATPase